MTCSRPASRAAAISFSLGDTILFAELSLFVSRFQCFQEPIKTFEGGVVGLEVFILAGQQETPLPGFGVHEQSSTASARSSTLLV